MTAYTPTPRTTLHRIPARGHYDRETVHAILDEAIHCHVGFVVDGQPFVVPTTFVRDGERLFVHGAAASRALRTMASGVPVCMTITLIDGLVLARSAFHHSINYRSVIVLGTAREVTEAGVKARALELLIDKISPGRSAIIRAPSDKELRATSVLALALEEVSAKVRQSGPLDDADDMARPVWAGVLPLALRAGPYVTDVAQTAEYEPPVLRPALTHST